MCVCGVRCGFEQHILLYELREARFCYWMLENILSGFPRIEFPSTTGICNKLTLHLGLPGHFQMWNLLTVLCDCWRKPDETGAMFKHTPNPRRCFNFVCRSWLWLMFCSHLTQLAGLISAGGFCSQWQSLPSLDIFFIWSMITCAQICLLQE